MKIEHGSKEWVKSVISLAHNYLIITQCKKCGAAVNSGYCCTTCGDTNPSQPPEKEGEE